ncbi:MAG: tyrosine-type recombinase/integrase [bacterium]|nr:tyrosine-type recombinase/integrase [bacterium]
MRKRGNGTGSIIDRGKNRYLRYSIRITVGYDIDTGKQQYKYLSSHHTRKDAEIALSQFIVNPYDLKARKLTFKDVFERAFEEYKKKNTSKQAVTSYSTAFKNCECLHNIPVFDIRKTHLQNCLDSQTKRSDSSLNNIIKTYHLIFNYCLENDLIQKDYSQFVEKREVKETSVREIFTEEEIKSLWEHQENDYIKITLMLLYTGFRVNELLTIKPEQINLADGYFKAGLKTKAGKDRIVPIHSKIMIFAEWLHSELTQDTFIINYPTYSNWLKNNLKHKAHDTRHTFTTLLQKYGANKVWIDKIVGHSSGNLTDDLYTHADYEELKKTVELLP